MMATKEETGTGMKVLDEYLAVYPHLIEAGVPSRTAAHVSYEIVGDNRRDEVDRLWKKVTMLESENDILRTQISRGGN